MTTNDNDAEGRVYGFKSDADKVGVDATIIGNNEVLSPDYRRPRPGVVLEDPASGHTFKLDPGAARRRAAMLREHSEDQGAGLLLADKIEAAANHAESLEVPDAE